MVMNNKLKKSFFYFLTCLSFLLVQPVYAADIEDCASTDVNIEIEPEDFPIDVSRWSVTEENYCIGYSGLLRIIAMPKFFKFASPEQALSKTQTLYSVLKDEAKNDRKETYILIGDHRLGGAGGWQLNVRLAERLRNISTGELLEEAELKMCPYSCEFEGSKPHYSNSKLEINNNDTLFDEANQSERYGISFIRVNLADGMLNSASLTIPHCEKVKKGIYSGKLKWTLVEL